MSLPPLNKGMLLMAKNDDEAKGPIGRWVNQERAAVMK